MSTWKRIGAYLGLVEEYDDEYVDPLDEQLTEPEHDRPASRAGGRASGRTESMPARSEQPTNVRRIAPGRSMGQGEAAEGGRDAPGGRPVSGAKVHVTNPTTFNDVEEVGERFRNGIPVIMNLAGASETVAKRLLDFASGLIFGLDGRIERVGDRVFLLTPLGVEVSSEERRRLGERGFFNQA